MFNQPFWLGHREFPPEYVIKKPNQIGNTNKPNCIVTYSFQPHFPTNETNEKLSLMVAWLSSDSISCFKGESSIGHLVSFSDSGNSVVSGILAVLQENWWVDGLSYEPSWMPGSLRRQVDWEQVGALARTGSLDLGFLFLQRRRMFRPFLPIVETYTFRCPLSSVSFPKETITDQMIRFLQRKEYEAHKKVKENPFLTCWRKFCTFLG